MSEQKVSTQKVIFPSIKDVPADKWEKLAQKKVYFAHQSVGFNIVDGIKDVMQEYPEIKLDIVETSEISDFKGGVFAHSIVGENFKPKTKISDFFRLIDSGIGDNADTASIKFCYLDMRAATDVDAILSDYNDSIVQLRTKYPEITIIHFTEPLTIFKTTWKTYIKKLIGKDVIWEYDDNIKRNEYNKMLLNQYEGKEPILDIAKIQSTYPDGTRSSFQKDGKTYYSLVPDYTYDVGHLNEVGRKKVAEQFLILLANSV